jgi:sporulation protein YlmC with PRC-barrel domain
MNKKLKILSLIFIFSIFLFGSSRAFAKEGTTGEVGASYHSMGWDTFEASWLIGHRVDSPLGDELGQIDDLMIDRVNGHVALVILSGVQGFGAEFVAAPFSALERTGENTFQLNFGDQHITIPLTPSDPYEDPYAYELYRNRSLVGLLTIPSWIDPLWTDSVYRFYGQTPYWTEGRTVPPDMMSYRTAQPFILQSLFMGKTAPVLMGASVHSKDGKTEARINDLVIDSKDGRVAFLVLDRVPGRASMQVAVPFGEMPWSGNDFVLNTTVDQLVSAPTFNVYADMNNLKWVSNDYRFFGQRPYWTEGGTQ